MAEEDNVQLTDEEREKIVLSEDEEKLTAMSMVELKFRHDLVNKVIKDAQKKDDDRWKGAPLEQLRKLNKVIVEKQRREREAKGIREPSPRGVGLEPLALEAEQLK